MMKHFHPRGQHIDRNPLATPLLKAALERLSPSPEARRLTELLRVGRIADAAAIADLILIDGDHI